MITEKTYDEWAELGKGDPADSVAALRDLAADLVSVVRELAQAGVFGPLGEVGNAARAVLRSGQAVHAGIVATGVAVADPVVGVTPEVLTTWRGLDRERALCDLADTYAWLLYVMNMVGDNVPQGVTSLAQQSEGLPCQYAVDAHRAVLTVLTGEANDAARVHDLWSDNHESTAWNLRQLAEQKRGESVRVVVAADGNTATVRLPGGLDCDAGRGADGGLFWVTDEMGDVIGHAPAWDGIGRTLADHYGYRPSTAVLVEYAEDRAQG